MVGLAEVEYTVIARRDVRIQAVAESLAASHVNGGVIVARFRPSIRATFAEASRIPLQRPGDRLRSFLQADSVRAALPELRIPHPLGALPDILWYSAYEFEGAIIHLLRQGGCYAQPTISDTAARKMSRELVDALIRKDRLGVFVCKMEKAWTPWFHDVAWDQTFLVHRWKSGHWALLCVTDTD